MIRASARTRELVLRRPQDPGGLSADVFLAVTLIGLLWAAPAAHAGAVTDGSHADFIAGNRIVVGTVKGVRGFQARIDTGQGQSRFAPMKVREEKGLRDLQSGDRVEIALNDQNLIVDVHLPDESSHHHIMIGQLAQPLVTGHWKAEIRREDGREVSHLIRPLARSKVASIPVGVEVVFLIDELDRVADVTYGSTQAAVRAAHLWENRSPLKASFSRTTGVILRPLQDDRISIRTDEGDKRRYEVRPLVQKRLASLHTGTVVALFVDEENKVTDVAGTPTYGQKQR